MKRLATSMAVAGIVLAGGSVPAAAQVMVSSPVRFGIMGGATIPISSLSDVSTTGWNAGALLDIGLPLVPVGFRIDGAWYQLGDKTFPDGSVTKNRFIAGTADIVLAPSSVAMTKLYFIGGIGLYNYRAEADNVPVFPPGGQAVVSSSGTETKFGVNAGIGLRVQLVGFAMFAEARWHDVFTSGASRQMIPIDVGFTF